jgi:hypothetical protein
MGGKIRLFLRPEIPLLFPSYGRKIPLLLVRFSMRATMTLRRKHPFYWDLTDLQNGSTASRLCKQGITGESPPATKRLETGRQNGPEISGYRGYSGADRSVVMAKNSGNSAASDECALREQGSQDCVAEREGLSAVSHLRH